MPRKKRLGVKRRGELTGPEDEELLWGTSGRPSVFDSVFTKRAAWMLNRAELMEDQPAGFRPAGWWEFEAPGQPRREGLYESTADCLRRLGELEEWEIVELDAGDRIRKEGVK